MSKQTQDWMIGLLLIIAGELLFLSVMLAVIHYDLHNPPWK